MNKKLNLEEACRIERSNSSHLKPYVAGDDVEKLHEEAIKSGKNAIQYESFEF